MTVETDLFFNCPHCASPLVVSSRGIGREIVCPDCERALVVPEKGSSEREVMAAFEREDEKSSLPQSEYAIEGRRTILPSPRRLEADGKEPADRLAEAARAGNLRLRTNDSLPPLEKRRVKERLPLPEPGEDPESKGPTLADLMGKWGRGRGKWLLSGMALFLLLGLGLVTLPERLSTKPAEESDVAEGPAEGGVAGELADLPSNRELLAQILPPLEAFLKADSVGEKFAYVRSPKRVRDHMVRFYALRGFSPRGLSRFPGDQEKNQVAVEMVQGERFFHVSTFDEEHRPVRASFVEEGGRFLLEWEAFVEMGDLLLEEFLRDQPKDKMLLRVILRPDDFYNHGFGEEDWLAFRMRDQRDEVSAIGYCDRGSVAFEEMRDHWTNMVVGPESSREVPVMVRARFRSMEGRPPQPVITDLVRFGWLAP